jgi:hypothetical protein
VKVKESSCALIWRQSGRANLRNEAICNAIAKRYKRHDNERRKGVTNVSPINLCNLANHHTANQDECTSRSPGWDRSKYRSKED